MGVKSRSAFASLVDGLPLTAPVDYMHCILQGVFPDVLKICYQSLKTQEKDSVNTLISELSCPREFHFRDESGLWMKCHSSKSTKCLIGEYSNMSNILFEPNSVL